MSLFSPQKRLIFRYLPFILRSNIRRENKQEESTVHLLFSVYLDGNDGRKRKRFISKTCVEPQLVSACKDRYTTCIRATADTEFSLFSKPSKASFRVRLLPPHVSNSVPRNLDGTKWMEIWFQTDL